MDLAIRPYEPGDEDAIWQVHLLALCAAGSQNADSDWYRDLRQIEAEYTRVGGAFLVGIADGQIVAMGGLQRLALNCAKIRRLRVEPEYWRHGYGTAILTALDEVARQLGYTTLLTDTTLQQEPAQALFLACGYEELGRMDRDSVTLITYRKTLADKG